VQVEQRGDARGDGLAWLLHHSPHTLLIPGTADTGHLEANLAAGSLVLGEEILAALDAVTPRPSGVPRP
jgi:aryl-alcohol dehydrogenase-like predicted oxidoreductase